MKKETTKHFLLWALLPLLTCTAICINSDVIAQPTLTYTPMIQNMRKPIEIKSAGDNSGRLFIAEQDGYIRIYKNGVLQSKPFLDISNLVSLGRYKGLISLEFAPNYKKNRTFFIYYFDKNNVATIARYRASFSNPDSAIASTGVTILQFPPIDTGDTKISIGNLNFGRDGYLYMSLSDGSYIDYVTNLAQNGSVLYGKMLRLNVNVANPPYYSIPPTNPFINDPNIRDEIWAIGIRNIWRFSFDRANGNMWMADDGNDNRDEVNVIRPSQSSGGFNLGWKCYEGFEVYDTTGCSDIGNYTFPIFDIPHDSITGGYALIGGYVYRGKQFPALNGYYVCSDYVTNNIWLINPNGSGGWNVTRQPGAPLGICSYGEGDNGEVYACSLDGTVYQVGAVAAAGAIQSTVASAAKTGIPGTMIYPTLVTGNSIVIDLKETYYSFHLLSMSGQEIMRRNLQQVRGKTTIELPNLSAGNYIVQLKGKQNLQQKIVVVK